MQAANLKLVLKILKVAKNERDQWKILLQKHSDPSARLLHTLVSLMLSPKLVFLSLDVSI